MIFPPREAFFDTGVWIQMSHHEACALEAFHKRYGLRIRLSITNFVELVPHLLDPPKRGKDKFNAYRACFRKIAALCDSEILPSPEMAFLTGCGLTHYLAPTWSPDVAQFASKVKAIADAEAVADLTSIDLSHYQQLCDTDEQSLHDLFALMTDVQSSVRSQIREFQRRVQTPTDHEIDASIVELRESILPTVDNWLWNFASFFLIERPSDKRMRDEKMAIAERRRFREAFANGSPRLFRNHALKRLADFAIGGRGIQSNDIYDMLQLLLIDEERVFVTSDKAFFSYQVDDPLAGHVLAWRDFIQSVCSSLK